jgi:hypothetical protein
MRCPGFSPDTAYITTFRLPVIRKEDLSNVDKAEIIGKECICCCLSINLSVSPSAPNNSVDGGEAAIMTQLSNTKPNNVPNVQMCKCAKGYRDANFSLPSLEAEANSVEHDNMVRKCNGYS